MMATAQSLFEQPAPMVERELRLQRLTLRNFKGIRDLEIDADGRSLAILGDNAVGKTTTADAYAWLLWDKDSQGRKEFDLKTLGDDGVPAHGLEHEVEGTFALGGRRITLRKVYAEKWVKQRGSAERQFSGHETAYYIDGVPVKKQDYEAKVASITDEQLFRLLSDPNAFNALHWQERRRTLVDVCGDISDREIIASDPELAPLAEILGKRSLEDHRKVLAAARTKVNRELEQIPIRISEVQRNLPDVAGLDPEEAERKLAAARASRQRIQERLAQAEQGGAVIDLQRRQAEIRSRLVDIESSCRRKADEQYSARHRAVQDARAEIGRAEHERDIVASRLPEAEHRADRLEAQLDQLRGTFRAAADETFQHTAETVCPTCGQMLPEEQVEGARAKALAQFNLGKSGRIEAINAEGRELKAKREEAVAEITRIREAIAKAEAKLPALQRELAKAEEDLQNVPKAPDPASDAAHRELAAERDGLTAEIERLRMGGSAKTEGLRAEIAALDRDVAAAETVISRVAQRSKGLERIEELRADEKRLAAEYEDLERQLYLTEAFVRAKVRLLTDRINGRFALARFRLFDVQVNGALVECCDTTYQGVPWNSLNHGAQINVGLDIIRTLAAHYGFRAPVWIDRRESVTRLIDLPCQVISLIVSEPDKTLRVEVC